MGSLYEVDVGTYGDRDPGGADFDTGEGGLALATHAPPKPTLSLEPELRHQDVYEVRICESRRNRRVVAAIEIVSPSNKERPEHRGAFVSKVAHLLKNDICLSIIDVVSTSYFNLYAELIDACNGVDPALEGEPTPMSAVTVRFRHENRKRMMDNWYYPLAIGRALPTLPIWLTETFAVSLDLEACYEETCRTLRIR